jgi:hypothetical protein
MEGLLKSFSVVSIILSIFLFFAHAFAFAFAMAYLSLWRSRQHMHFVALPLLPNVHHALKFCVKMEMEMEIRVSECYYMIT